MFADCNCINCRFDRFLAKREKAYYLQGADAVIDVIDFNDLSERVPEPLLSVMEPPEEESSAAASA